MIYAIIVYVSLTLFLNAAEGTTPWWLHFIFWGYAVLRTVHLVRESRTTAVIEEIDESCTTDERVADDRDFPQDEVQVQWTTARNSEQHPHYY